MAQHHPSQATDSRQRHHSFVLLRSFAGFDLHWEYARTYSPDPRVRADVLVGPVAFYAITSLSTVSLLQCYCLSIGCCLWRRIYKPETLPPAKFSLGRFGIPLNVMAVAYSLWAFFWAYVY